MVLYRTAGPWGAGKGANLLAAEVDENFYELAAAITELVENPLAGTSVVGFTVTGRTFKVLLSDGSEFGPYLLPYEGWKWSGDLVPGTTYNPQDVFSVPGFGVYLVLDLYTAPEVTTEGDFVFDPAASNTEGPLLQQILGLMPSSVLTIVPFTGDRLVTAADLGGYLRPGEITDTTAIILPGSEDDEFPLGGTVTVRAPTGGAYFVGSSTAVVINSPESMALRKGGSLATAIRIGADEWDIAGDLELL